MVEFTPKQGHYLAFIHAYTEGFGFPPTESNGQRQLRLAVWALAPVFHRRNRG